jgi:hypothetical protein
MKTFGKVSLSIAAWLFSIKLAIASQPTIDTINATFSNSPLPFKIDVDPQFIRDTKTKVSLFRYPKADLGLPDTEEGPSHADAKWFRDYWVNEYNWTAVQDELNLL